MGIGSGSLLSLGQNRISVNLYITWNVTPEIFDGLKTPNLYGLLFVTGLAIGYFVIKNMFKREGVREEILDKLVFYMVISTIVGARLGHVFFYGPYFDEIDANGYLHRGYFSHPEDIFKVWEGGLASHGAAVVILIALYIFSKKVSKRSYMWILDRIVAPIIIAGCFIRLGNLVNSEIVGIPSNAPWAFSFPNYYNDLTGKLDPTPRHPAQLYEAIAYLFIFVFLMYLYYKKNLYLISGRLFGWFLVLVWGARFSIEFIKVGQTARDYTFALNTGQLLSIPLILIGVYLLVRRPVEKIEVE